MKGIGRHRSSAGLSHCWRSTRVWFQPQASLRSFEVFWPLPLTPESTRHSGHGAWRRIFAETIGPDGSRYPGRILEGFLLISDGFYSMNWAFGPEASEYYSERFSPTDDEKIARYDVLLVNSGRFDLDGNVLTIHPIFAMVPEFIGGLGEFEYAVDGDTLELVWRRIVSADGFPDPYTDAGVRYVSRWERISQ